MPADARIGERIPDRAFAVELWPMKVFSVLMGDPNPIHFDPELVREMGLEAPVNQGTITMGYPVSAVFEWAGGPDRLRSFRCRFAGNVVAGDRVTAGGEVTALGTDADGARTATLDVWLEREDGSRPVSGTAVVLLLD